MSRADTIAQHADDAYESIRALAHTYVGRPPVPAPEAYALLGSLKRAGGHTLEQVLNDVAAGLRRSLLAYDVYDNARPPRESVETAAGAMEDAASLIGAAARLLEQAQTAISQQGYRAP